LKFEKGKSSSPKALNLKKRVDEKGSECPFIFGF